jgi:hypothetical protein
MCVVLLVAFITAITSFICRLLGKTCGTVYCKLSWLKNGIKLHFILVLLTLAVAGIYQYMMMERQITYYEDWRWYATMLLCLLIIIYNIRRMYLLWDLNINYYRYKVEYEINDFKKLKDTCPNNSYVNTPPQVDNFNMSLRLAPNGSTDCVGRFNVYLNCDFIQNLEGCKARVIIYDAKNTWDCENVIQMSESKNNFQNQFYFRIDSNLPLNLENEKTAGFKGFKLSDIEDKMGELNSFKIVFFVYKPHKIRKKQKKKMMGKMEDNNTVDHGYELMENGENINNNDDNRRRKDVVSSEAIISGSSSGEEEIKLEMP